MVRRAESFHQRRALSRFQTKKGALLLDDIEIVEDSVTYGCAHLTSVLNDTTVNIRILNVSVYQKAFLLVRVMKAEDPTNPLRVASLSHVKFMSAFLACTVSTTLRAHYL